MQETDNVNEESSLLAAWLLDGDGGGQSLDWVGIGKWEPDQGVLWVHLDRLNPQAREWMTCQSGIDPYTAEAMFGDDSRPLYMPDKSRKTAILNLRTPNINQDETVDDTLSVRLWSDGQRIFTTRRLPIWALHDIDEKLKSGDGPIDASDFIEILCMCIADTIVSALNDLEDQVIALEKALFSPQHTLTEHQKQVMVLQRKAINLRQYITFQPNVLYDIERKTTSFMQDRNLQQLRDAAHKMTYAQSWVDSLYDRAFNCQQQIYMHLTSKTSRTTYLLTVVASVFLPLSFLTGLLGANIGGIPGTDNPAAFWFLIVLCACIIFGQILLLRFLKWF